VQHTEDHLFEAALQMQLLQATQLWFVVVLAHRCNVLLHTWLYKSKGLTEVEVSDRACEKIADVGAKIKCAHPVLTFNVVAIFKTHVAVKQVAVAWHCSGHSCCSAPVLQLPVQHVREGMIVVTYYTSTLGEAESYVVLSDRHRYCTAFHIISKEHTCLEVI
jgi:hypothetical protein